MTLSQKNNYILDIQCKYSSLIDTFNKYLKMGSCKAKNMSVKLFLIRNYLDIIKRYLTESEDSLYLEKNCLTEEEICSIVNITYYLIETKCNCN